MAISTIDLPIFETEANLRWNLPVWLVLICVVTFSVLLGAEIVLIGAIAVFLSLRILGEAKCWTGM